MEHPLHIYLEQLLVGGSRVSGINLSYCTLAAVDGTHHAKHQGRLGKFLQGLVQS